MEFSDDSSTSNPENDMASFNPKKRARLDPSDDVNGSTSATATAVETTTQADPALLEHAKKRLSKWAARLFDPDRPRGLVQAPQTIPLNDEFLAAFGKREKKYDEETGNVLKVDSIIESDDENDDGDNETHSKKKKAAQMKKNRDKAAKTKGKSRTKVKVSNLAYRTSVVTLTAACEQFGSLVDIKLILDGDREPSPNMQNSGRGYVTFESAEDAEACIEGLTSLDGRAIRLTLANMKPQGGGQGGPSSSSAGPPRPASELNRSMEKDISTICFRCGGVGHIEAECPNPAKPKPCPLCGSTEHIMYQCPYKQICFNCGTPGHVSRECPYQRGLPRRVICSICLQPGHHRLQCRAGEAYVYSSPYLKGGFDIMNGSKSLKWFHGLQGVTCFNCGSKGHFGWECSRPKVYHLIQDSDLANREIERASVDCIADQIEQQRSRNRGRDRDREGQSHHRRREVQSMPPKRGGGGRSSSNGSSNGRINHGGGGSRFNGGEGQLSWQDNRGYSTNGGNRKRSRGY